MSARFACIFATLGFVLCLAPRATNAFEDANCSHLVSVQVRDIQEPYGTAVEYAAARARAQQRAYEEAAAQAIGIWVESKRQDETRVDQGSILERFSQLDKSELSGFIRPTNAKEISTKIGDQDAVSLTLDAVVCVPKPEFLTKWRQEKLDRERKAPQPVDPRSSPWFDARSGQALLWYWRDKDQQYFFFDNKGFDPKTGEALQPVTSKVRDEWRQAEETRARTEQQREENDRRQREAADAREQLLAAAPDNCDRLAGNPDDRNHSTSIAGATFDTLKDNVENAVAACEAAVQKNPSQLRFRYQLARAYQVTSPQKAIPILRTLMDRRYAAAFDNYGWALLDRRTDHNDLDAAIISFRRGAALGDPGSQFSLASLIIDGKADSGDLEQALRWLRSAAQQGHLLAQARIPEVEEALNIQRQKAAEADEASKRKAVEEEQAREMFLRVMGGFIQNMPRN